jgi:hypothetical protein
MRIVKPSKILAQNNIRRLWPFSDMADVIRVIVCSLACSLRQCLSNPDCDSLQGGSILAETIPLAAYSIADGAMVVAVAIDCFQAKERWAELVRDQTKFEERMAASTDPRIALESAGLSDIRMRRIGDCRAPGRR